MLVSFFPSDPTRFARKLKGGQHILCDGHEFGVEIEALEHCKPIHELVVTHSQPTCTYCLS